MAGSAREPKGTRKHTHMSRSCCDLRLRDGKEPSEATIHLGGVALSGIFPLTARPVYHPPIGWENVAGTFSPVNIEEAEFD